MIVVPVARRFLPLIRRGEKSSTIRKGTRPYPIGPAVLRSDGEEIRILITGVRFSTTASLTQSDAVKDGFESLGELLDALREFYPDLLPSDSVTITSFRIRYE